VGVEAANGFLKLVIELRGKRPFVPRGVYRFKSNEESDAWFRRMVSRQDLSAAPRP
jgi:hypothetical protein